MTLRFVVGLANQIILGSAPGPQVIIGVAPIPPELTAYYAAGAPNTKTPPETVYAVNQYLDGHGNYVYQAVVIDSTATPITTLASGAVVGGVVNEASRFAIDPGSILGGARYQTFTDEMITILTSSADGTTVLAAQHPGDAFHVWSVNTIGTMGWGDGTAITDTYLARTAAGAMELAEFLRVRNYTGLTENAFECRLNGESNGRLFIHVDGTLRWSNGTNAPDTGISRGGVNLLNVDGDLAIASLGDGLLIKEGSNGAEGVVTLVAGAATVNVNWIQNNSRIFLTCQVPGGTPGALRVDSRIVNTSFTIKSTSAVDTSTVAYLINSPA